MPRSLFAGPDDPVLALDATGEATPPIKPQSNSQS